MLNSKIPEHGHGAIRHLRELNALLTEEPARPTLVGLHHSPIATCPSKGCTLLNATEFLEVVTSHEQVKVVVAGHNHEDATATIDHVRVFTAPSTCVGGIHPSEDDEKAHTGNFFDSHAFDATSRGYRLLDLQPNGSFSATTHWI